MKYTILDVEVEFPYEAYPCQIAFMESNIKALIGSMNAILESPTGTGKTLCLLCSTIAYQQHLRMKEGRTFKIFYSSRTHAQLSQVIKELRTTSYHDVVRTAVLGSRDHLCVEPVVNQHRGAMLNSQCRRLVKNKACAYSNKVSRSCGPESAPILANCADIEDMYNMGSSKGFCPFYQSRETMKIADIVFVPYNYVVDPQDSADETQKLDLAGGVVIIDEAHNIERVCEDAASITFGTLDIHHSIRFVEKAMEQLSEERMLRTNGDERREEHSEVQNLNASEKRMEELVKMLRNMEHLLTKFELTEVDSSGRREKGITGQDVVGIFLKSGCTKANYRSHVEAIDDAQERINDTDALADRSSVATAVFLQNCRDVISLLFSGTESGHQLDEYFRAFVQVGDTRPQAAGSELKETRVINMYCLSGSVTMRALVETKKVRNIVLASGTLSPMGLLQQSLGIPFGVILQNTHVIDAAVQVRVGVVCTGPNRVALNGSYQNKANADYINDLGNLVVNIAKVAPEGALLVFHSYSQMATVIRSWTDSGIQARINREKTVFVEPRNAGELSDVLKQFATTSLSNSGGAILFCVCRGKVTEGVDLADNQCRLVMIAGIPFPAIQDRKVILKREYLDSKNGGDGGKWYRQEAARTVNQTIGRVVRHRRDYGAILLLDERYRSYVGSNDLPGWVQGQVKMYPQFGPVMKDMTDFFRNIPKELLRKAPVGNRVLGRNNSLNLSGGGLDSASSMWNAERQLESIHKLISSVPANKVTAPASLPALTTSFPSGAAFKMSAPVPARHVLARIPTGDAATAPSQSSTTSPMQWITRIKAELSRRDYILLKQHLRRLLEGAHGQCDITIREALVTLKDLLKKANMLDSFEPVIAGTNSLLKQRWDELR